MLANLWIIFLDLLLIAGITFIILLLYVVLSFPFNQRKEARERKERFNKFMDFAKEFNAPNEEEKPKKTRKTKKDTK